MPTNQTDAKQKKNKYFPCGVCGQQIKRPHYRWLTGEGVDDVDLCGSCFFTAVRLRLAGRSLDLYIFLRLDEEEFSFQTSPPLPDQVVLDMRYARARGARVCEIAAQYFITPQRASEITRGLSYRHVGGPIAD